MATKSPSVEIDVDDRVIRVSNPDRVYFPESGATKLDLVQYYLAVGPGIVNALFERPTMLHRFPKGLAGDKVHQKRVPAGAPPWIETVRLHFPRWNRTADELCVTELGAVIWAVQMSTVEFHPWNSRRDDPEKPDEWRIDLDPGPLSDYPQVRRVAAVVHEVLDELGAVGYPKTSGGKGMHIYVRIHPDHGHKVVRRAALAFAREVERRTPDDVTTAWWRKDRDPHHLFVDYNQNARDHTIAAAYSVRGFAGRPGLGARAVERDRRRRPPRLHDLHHARPVRRARRPARGHRRRRLRHRAAPRVGRPRRARRSGDSRRAGRVRGLRMTDVRLPLASIDVSMLAEFVDQQEWAAAYLDPATGEIRPASGDDAPDDRLPVGGGSSRLAYADMESFVEALADRRLAERLQLALEGKGAFRRFRDVMYREADETAGRAWNAYREARSEQRALEWLSEHDLVEQAELDAARTGFEAKALEALREVGVPVTGARLILLNGMPGAGKSTLAARYLADHAGILCVEADLLRAWIGGAPADLAEATRRLSLAMAAAHLASGRDVVVPQLVARVDQVERFEQVAHDAGAELVEVVLHGSVVEARVPDEALDHLVDYAQGLAEVVERRPATHRLAVHHDIDATYRDLLDVLDRDVPA